MVSAAMLTAGVVLTDYDGGEGRELSALQRGAALLLGFATLCLVWTALYLSFTPVGADVIRGVQGRYYLPVTHDGSAGGTDNSAAKLSAAADRPDRGDGRCLFFCCFAPCIPE